MLKIKEQSPDRLVLDKVPVSFRVLCFFFLLTGAVSLIVISKSAIAGYYIGATFIVLACLLFMVWGGSKSIIVRRNKRALYYVRKSIFGSRVKKYFFFEINNISLKEEDRVKDPAQPFSGKYKVIMEKSSGKRKILFYTNNDAVAHQTAEVLNDYLHSVN